MSSKSKGVAFLLAGGLGLVCALAAIAMGAFRMVESFRALETFEAPGSMTIEVEDAGPVTLWHDYRGIFEGRSVRHEEDLPSGFTFEMVGSADGQAISLSSRRGTSRTSNGSSARVGIGTFHLPEAGSYEVRIDGPEARFFSVTEGSAFSGIASLFGGFGLGMVLGLIGLTLCVVGITMLLSGRTKRSSDASA